MEGAEVVTTGKVEVPTHAMVYQGRQRGLICSVVASIPRGIQLLIGLPTIRSRNYKLLLDLGGCRVYVRAVFETIRLDVLSKVLKRLKAEPAVVLSLCAGLCVELYVMLELGFRIEEVLVIEESVILCEMLKKTHGRLVRVMGHDVVGWEEAGFLGWFPRRLLSAFAGPPCTPWSRLREDEGQKGFLDPRSVVFVACARLLELLEGNGLLSQSALETVEVRRDLANDVSAQEVLCGGPLHVVNASQHGSAANRPRRYSVRGADMSSIQAMEHSNPSMMLELGWRLEREPAECLVSAGANTKMPV